MNDNLVLISGMSTTGKSASLRNLTNPEKVIYMNTEANKKLPFRSKFKEVSITDPLQVEGFYQMAETAGDKCETIITDSLTYLMDQYETNHVIYSTNTMQAWGEFAQFFKKMMQRDVANSTKNVIMLAHTMSTLNEDTMQMETKVPVKGALKNNGLESYFSTVISTKRMRILDIDHFKSDLLNITDDEREDGFKYVFQTIVTKETVNERIRAPMGMWSRNETFIDNDAQLVLDRLHSYYK